MSKKGMDPSAFDVSAVNFMLVLSEFRCGKNSSLYLSSRMTRKTFSHTPDEAMSDGLAKACGLGKMYSVEEKISYFIENQTE